MKKKKENGINWTQILSLLIVCTMIVIVALCSIKPNTKNLNLNMKYENNKVDVTMQTTKEN